MPAFTAGPDAAEVAGLHQHAGDERGAPTARARCGQAARASAIQTKKQTRREREADREERERRRVRHRQAGDDEAGAQISTNTHGIARRRARAAIAAFSGHAARISGSAFCR